VQSESSRNLSSVNISHLRNSYDVHSVKLFMFQLLLHVDNIVSVCTSRVLVLALTCAALNRIIKLFCRTKRKHDSPNHLAGCLSLPKEVLTKLEPCHILTCFSNDEPEALTAVITDMANALNETLKKEEGIVITNGWKLDIAAMQRYDAYRIYLNLIRTCIYSALSFWRFLKQKKVSLRF